MPETYWLLIVLLLSVLFIILGTTKFKIHPFIIAAAFKTAQGSSTVALLATSALIAPLLSTIGLDSLNGKVLAVMATGAGAMTISHANDSFFWVVTQFSGMDVKTGYRTQTIATLIQGVSAMILIYALSLIFL